LRSVGLFGANYSAPNRGRGTTDHHRLESYPNARNSAHELRLFVTAIIDPGDSLFINERKVHIAQVSNTERWPSSLEYLATMDEMLREILIEGRTAGEFERKPPLS
jgi:hypothetical protein